MHKEELCKVELNQLIIDKSKKLQDDVQKLGLKIKHHEENLKFLKAVTNDLDESILDIQVSLGKYHSSSEAKIETENLNHFQTEEDTIEQILRQEKSAAGILCQLKMRHGTQASYLPLTKDVLGIVATLGKVDNDNLSRLLSEYLGLETMMAIVCMTYEGVKTLEMCDKEGRINKSAGLHGLGPSIGRPMDGRFLVICLEGLRPYAGDFVADDPQRKLALLKPRLPNGDVPPGFIGFAVNMITVDSMNLSCLTASGHGLRETLFYSLFSRLQVYRTRADMLLATPCISDGAISLDGGMIRSTGIFSLGERKDIKVRFPISCTTSNLPANYIDMEDRIKEMKWEKERILEDMQREQALLDHVKINYKEKKQEFLRFLKESSQYVAQNEAQMMQNRSFPR
ncbi:PREDICTED: protein DEFECTIVE IN MERISTEM SILENCING 3 isoform X2 [Nelumbo nucifera]|nr:PREDICTED: protein DEFECTIVE IN MERISTEM SILENCING 3 isoform X2 [Nelumbo nucifera]